MPGGNGARRGAATSTDGAERRGVPRGDSIRRRGIPRGDDIGRRSGSESTASSSGAAAPFYSLGGQTQLGGGLKKLGDGSSLPSGSRNGRSPLSSGARGGLSPLPSDSRGDLSLSATARCPFPTQIEGGSPMSFSGAR